MQSLMVRLQVLLVAGLVLAVAFDARAQSQATTGVIEGTVVDASGAALPGVTVTLHNTGDELRRASSSPMPTAASAACCCRSGTYQLTVALAGLRQLRAGGHRARVGQTANIPIVAAGRRRRGGDRGHRRVAGRRDDAHRGGDAHRPEGAVAGLPNNGRNFLDFMQLTPGVTIVQGPDGDELSINGQKGITNNISVDGADFNNPFFGEQRGGQRPAFTFNLDAVKEMVVVADGANAEFGRSRSGFVNVVTKSGTNDIERHRARLLQERLAAREPKNPDGGDAEVRRSIRTQVGFTLGGPLRQDRLFYFLRLRLPAGRPDQADRSRPASSRASSTSSPRSAARTRTARSSAPTTRACSSARSTGSSRRRTCSPSATTTPGREQENGTFDVDSWGRSANAIEKDFSHAVIGLADLDAVAATLLNEFRFQFAREDRPRPYDGPNITGQSRPLPDTAFDFGSGYRFGEPFFIPVEYYDTRVQFNDNVSFLRGAHTIKVGVEFNRVNSVQTFVGFANGRYIFGTTDGFLNYAAVRPELRRVLERHDAARPASCPAGATITGPLLLYLQQAGVGGLIGRGGGHAGHPADRAGALHPGQVAADAAT